VCAPRLGTTITSGPNAPKGAFPQILDSACFSPFFSREFLRNRDEKADENPPRGFADIRHEKRVQFMWRIAGFAEESAQIAL
jgi:hypothetical protein